MSKGIVVDLDGLRENLERIWRFLARTRARVLLDQTALPVPRLYPMLGLYLSGTVGATRAELEQGLRWMDRDSHGRPAPDCTEAAFRELLPWCSHLVYADLEQWRRFDRIARQSHPSRGLLVRAAPDCAGGVPLEELPVPLPKGLSSLCIRLRSPGPAALASAAAALEERLGGPPRLYALDIGGNWPLTDPAFPLKELEELLRDLTGRWSLAHAALTVGDAVTREAVTAAPEGVYVLQGGAPRPFTGF